MTSTISTMDQVTKLHQQAMELCDRAIASRSIGDHVAADELFHKSFEAEREAASLVSAMIDLEPTRSVLHRSAATLALDCSEFRAAEQLIAAALAGNPPDEIAEELRDLYEQVNFGRHLELRGLELSPGEFQISLSGSKVGFGIALSEEFVGRVQKTEKLIFRTFERQSGRPFREAGRANREVSRQCETYISIPRAGSFAATMRVGVPHRQPNLPGFEGPPVDEPARIIDNLAQCLDAFSRDDQATLDALITDPAYHRNFVGLAEQLLPDGDNIKQVGFTISRDGVQQSIALRHTRPVVRAKELVRENGLIVIEGRLLYADSPSDSKNFIKVTDDAGKRHPVRVPAGMMTDIVKPLWEDRVVVYGRLGPNTKTIQLERITKALDPVNTQ